MRKEKVNIKIFSILLLFLNISCKTHEIKLKCLNNFILEHLDDKIIIRNQLNDTIQSWLKLGLKSKGIIRFSSTNWKVDEVVYFNSKLNAAIILILRQDNGNEAKMDFIELVFAKKEVNTWNFYYQGMPSLSAERYYTGKKDPTIPYTFEELSNLGKRKLIEGGYLKKCGCKINDEWVNAWYSETLEGMHRDFLNNK